MSGATPGSSKSRGSSRQRKLSQEPTRSTRSSAASTASYAPGVASSRPRPSTANSAAPAAASGGLNQWQALHGQSSNGAPSTMKKDHPAATTSPVKKVETIEQKSLPPFTFAAPTVSTTKPSSSVAKKEDSSPAHGLPTTGFNGVDACATPQPKTSWQLTDVTNTLKDRAAYVTAPHLRIKQALKAATTPGVMPADTEPVTAVNGIQPAETTFQPAKSVSQPAATVLQPATNDDQPAAKNIQPTTTAASNATKQSAASSGGPSGNTLELLQALKHDIAAVTKRIEGLETENLSLQKQVEEMVQKEERRKFLGTDDGSRPHSESMSRMVSSILNPGRRRSR